MLYDVIVLITKSRGKKLCQYLAPTRSFQNGMGTLSNFLLKLKIYKGKRFVFSFIAINVKISTSTHIILLLRLYIIYTRKLFFNLKYR